MLSLRFMNIKNMKQNEKKKKKKQKDLKKAIKNDTLKNEIKIISNYEIHSE